jgi:hypothetical protein
VLKERWEGDFLEEVGVVTAKAFTKKIIKYNTRYL